MTGYDHYNFPAFDAARDRIRELGHIPISPADLDRAIGFDPYNPTAVRDIRIDGAFIDHAIMRDAAAIIQCDGIVLLDGWENSRGAKGEKGIAEWKGLLIFHGVDTLEAYSPAEAPAA